MNKLRELKRENRFNDIYEFINMIELSSKLFQNSEISINNTDFYHEFIVENSKYKLKVSIPLLNSYLIK
mgnify:CR=1 FL=1|jgi:hypothetical protein